MYSVAPKPPADRQPWTPNSLARTAHAFDLGRCIHPKLRFSAITERRHACRAEPKLNKKDDWFV